MLATPKHMTQVTSVRAATVDTGEISSAIAAAPPGGGSIDWSRHRPPRPSDSEEVIVTVVDLVVLAVVALAALRGWRRGGTGLVLRAVGAVLGVLAGGAVARWLAPSLPFPPVATAVVGAVIGAMVGWALGRRAGWSLARRGDGGLHRPGVPDRALGVVAHGALALLVLVVVADVVAVTGPAMLRDAAHESTVVGAATDRLPDPVGLLPGGRAGVADTVTALRTGAGR